MLATDSSECVAPQEEVDQVDGSTAVDSGAPLTRECCGSSSTCSSLPSLMSLLVPPPPHDWNNGPNAASCSIPSMAAALPLPVAKGSGSPSQLHILLITQPGGSSNSSTVACASGSQSSVRKNSSTCSPVMLNLYPGTGLVQRPEMQVRA